MAKKAPQEEWVDNPGHLPKGAKGKRVRVVLAKDLEEMREPIYDDAWNPMSPPGWAADGKGGCSWTKTDSPFDIAKFIVV